jgi:hypothetical protein
MDACMDGCMHACMRKRARPPAHPPLETLTHNLLLPCAPDHTHSQTNACMCAHACKCCMCAHARVAWVMGARIRDALHRCTDAPNDHPPGVTLYMSRDRQHTRNPQMNDSAGWNPRNMAENLMQVRVVRNRDAMIEIRGNGSNL